MPFINDIGIPGLLIILIIALIVIGPGKLPEVGGALGRGIREFRHASTDIVNSASGKSDSAAEQAVTPAVVTETPEEQLARVTRERDELAAQLSAARSSPDPTSDRSAS